MNTNELFKMEHENQNEIHLVKAGKFWQAWEKSAFFFVKNFESYEVKARFIKKINAEMVYLGFPLLGAYVLPYRTYPGRRTVLNFKRCVLNPCYDEKRQISRIQSYMDYMGHYNAYRLTESILYGES